MRGGSDALENPNLEISPQPVQKVRVEIVDRRETVRRPERQSAIKNVPSPDQRKGVTTNKITKKSTRQHFRHHQLRFTKMADHVHELFGRTRTRRALRPQGSAANPASGREQRP